MHLRLESEEHATREPSRLAFVGDDEAPIARGTHDAANGRTRRDHVADRADEVEYARLRHHAAERARAHAGLDERREAEQHRRERELRGACHARLVVEELAQEEPHAAGVRVGPAHQAAYQRVEAVGPRQLLLDERARHGSFELLADDAEHGRVELLLLREVVDDGGER